MGGINLVQLLDGLDGIILEVKLGEVGKTDVEDVVDE